MPYTGISDKNLPKNVKELSAKLRKLWVSVWNSTFKKYKDESKAFKMANATIKKLKAEGSLFEIQSSVGDVKDVKELKDEDFVNYGVNPSLAKYRPNCKVIEGRLFAAGLPFCPSSEGITEGYNFVVEKETVENSLWQLTNMPVHINTELSAHSDETDEGKKYTAIGTILGSKMSKVEDEDWVDVLCALWEADHKDEVNAVKENKDKLGMSVEMFFDPEQIEAVDYNILNVKDIMFKGLAILQKAKAAFPQTQLLVASTFNGKENVYNIESKEENGMNIKIESDGTSKGTKLFVDDKEIKNVQNMNFSVYSVGEYDSGVVGEEKPYFSYTLVDKEKDGMTVSKNYRLSAAGIEAMNAEPSGSEPTTSEVEENNEGGGKVMEYNGMKFDKDTYTPEEIVKVLEARDAEGEAQKKLDEKDAEIKARDAKIAEFEAKAQEAEAEKEKEAKIEAEKNAKAEAEAWYEKNKDSYLPDNKDEIVSIRTKIELNSATKDEILKLTELKKTSGELSASTGENEEEKTKKIDNLFGIKTAVKQ